MSVVIKKQLYGKDKVRLVKRAFLSPDPAAPHLSHESVRELTIRVLLAGDFDASYTEADNKLVVPTDTGEIGIIIFINFVESSLLLPLNLSLAKFSHFIEVTLLFFFLIIRLFLFFFLFF